MATKIFEHIEALKADVTGLPIIATMGFFDGVHKGHQYLVEQLLERAKDRNACSMIITLAQHPREILSPTTSNTLICSPQVRAESKS